MDGSDWRPTATFEKLRARARMLARIRAFFAEREVMEVDTPALSLSETCDPNIQSFGVDDTGGRRFLHTSPEYAMKRLLAAGIGDIFQMTKVYRRNESGRFHNPEFTLLEWYRIGWSYHQLMDEVESLVHYALNSAVPLKNSLRLSYRQIFQQFAGIEPFGDSMEKIRACADQLGFEFQPDRLDRDGYLDLLMSHRIAPALPKDRLTCVFDYPSSQAALALIRQGIPPVAERFEIFWGAMELANGYHELTDASEQQARFMRELEYRKKLGELPMGIDKRLICALGHGLPECSGVALGVDRLLMVTTEAQHINEVLSFPWDRA